jgi:hypothetical protein
MREVVDQVGPESASRADRPPDRTEQIALRRLWRTVRPRPRGSRRQARQRHARLTPVPYLPSHAPGGTQRAHAGNSANWQPARDQTSRGRSNGRVRSPAFRRLFGLPAPDSAAVQAPTRPPGLLPLLPRFPERSVTAGYRLSAISTLLSAMGGSGNRRLAAVRRRLIADSR